MNYHTFALFTVILEERHDHPLRFRCNSAFSCGSKPWFGFLPTMEAHGSLWMLLDTLLEKDTLNSWNIYKDKSGALLVWVRFSPRHSASNVGSTEANNGLNIGFKRKSLAQLARDRERVITFNERRLTRIQAQGSNDADVPGMEKERCDTESNFSDTGLSGLVSPAMTATESWLDPLGLFSCSAPPPIEEQSSGKPASPALEPACPAPTCHRRPSCQPCHVLSMYHHPMDLRHSTAVVSGCLVNVKFWIEGHRVAQTILACTVED